MRAVAGLIGVLWFLYATFYSGFTIFLYLAGERHWDAFWAYLLSLMGLTPVLGNFAAVFMANAEHDWGFFHAAFNLLGWIVPLAIAGRERRMPKFAKAE